MAEPSPRPALSATRALGIALRTAHLGAMAVLAGGAWQGLPEAALGGAAAATAVSGVALALSEASHARKWIVQSRGLLVLAHAGLALVAGRLGPGALMAVLAIGAVGSHLPRGLRHWSPWRAGAEE